MRRGLRGRREQLPRSARAVRSSLPPFRPFGGADEQRPSVVAAEHARETPAVDVERVGHLATVERATAAKA
jgi:hypothetical protein